MLNQARRRKIYSEYISSNARYGAMLASPLLFGMEA